MSMSGSSARLCADHVASALLRRRVPVYSAALRTTRPTYITDYRRSLHGGLSYRSRTNPGIPRRSSRSNAGVYSANQGVRRWAVTVADDGAAVKAPAAETGGPLAEYNTRVQAGRLRDDPYQRRK